MSDSFNVKTTTYGIVNLHCTLVSVESILYTNIMLTYAFYNYISIIVQLTVLPQMMSGLGIFL